MYRKLSMSTTIPKDAMGVTGQGGSANPGLVVAAPD